MKDLKQLAALSAFALAGVGGAPLASALDLTYIEGTNIPAPYVTYGDGNSYSLPVLGILYDYYNNGTTSNSITPGNPYYVNSSPGAIKDLTVIGTGARGGPINTNFPGMDNAYPTPNSSGLEFFSTNKTAYTGLCGTNNCLLPNDPGGTNEFSGDAADTWDVRLTSLNDYTNNGSPVFFFNNNQVSSGDAENQNLAIWAALTLYDDQGALDPLTLYFTNGGGKYALVSEGGGGVLNGTAGSGTLGTPTGPLAGDNNATDYVLSGGALCYTATMSVVSCTSPDAVGGPINHNLGANQAVYAVVFPALNDILALADFGGYDVLSLDWRMGCDPNTDPNTSCTGSAGNHGRSLNNGYEQLFIGSMPRVTTVSEPATLALLGSALLGFAAMRRRKA
ncbi:MAG TPA: PEP-CTERM sorting domain-containing protein [Thiobacillaceae bacterium]|nr:PEP-CTERM sorting domain-containing protein [Thiobacillaceae bacterium]